MIKKILLGLVALIVIVLIVIVAWLARDKATALASSVGEVATGLVGLRAEVHSLRGALQDHATATDEL